MKPSLLKISGLNSFSQTETIDFSKLIEKGLFGIFGPTGSGKSTILDAITLALYGGVARKTKSYINSECEKTNIYFEFFSGYGENRKKYIIDRTIKRTKTGTQTANVTLEIYTEDGRVRENLIEKRSAVEKELIENIVKLNFEDFIRTVVLPQGKFSEFLTLTGSERNEMLERILGLEEYGQSLTDKINIKRSETNSQLDKLEGERTRYSDSSEEKLLELEKLKTKLLLEEETLRLDLEKLEIDYKKQKNVFELQGELDIYREKEKLLSDSETKMREVSKRLNMARDALHIAPLVDTFDRDVRDREENETYLSKITIELKNLVESLVLVEKNYKHAYNRKEDKYEPLVEKKSRLDALIELELDNFKNRELLKDETHEHNKINEYIRKKTENLERVYAKYEALETKVQDVESKLKKKNISSNYKKLVVDGLDIEKSFKLAEMQITEKNTELLKLRERIENGEKKIQQLKLSKESLKDKLEDEKIAYIDLREILLSKECFLDEINKEIEDEKEKSIANSLAKHLEEGEACPVCGSIKHPDIAKSVDQTLLKEKNTVKLETEKEIKTLSQELMFIKSLLKSNKLVKDFDEADMHSSHKDKKYKREELESMKSIEFIEKTQMLKNRLEDLNSEIIDLDKRDVEYNTLLDNIDDNFKKINLETKDLEKSLDELKDRYLEAKTQLSTEDIKAKYDQVTALEVEAEELNKNLEAYREELRQIISSKGSLEKEIQQDNVEFEKLCFSIKEKKKQIERNQEEINKVTEGESLTELKEKVDRELRKIISDEKQLREELDKLKDKNTVLTEQKLTAINTETKLNNNIEKTKAQIEKLLEEYKFESVEKVRDSRLDREDISMLEGELNKYRSEREEISSNIDRIKKLLGDNSTTKSILNELETRKVEKTKRQQELLEEKGSVLEKLLEMNKDIDRVNSIDKKIKTLTIRKDSLDEIGKMTKGKRFVEFVSRNHLKYIAKVATVKLKDITRGRFGLILNGDSAFEIVDNYNGGITRDASSLSGGETFLTSLALALALSTKIQLKGNTSMEFFFLDEGFGTLDVETLDTAMTALEKLYTENLSVGIISHVEEIKNRVPIKLMVSSPIPGIRGSEVHIQRT